MGILSNFMNLNRYEILARIVIILLVLPLHEFAHGWVARKCGDDTAEAAGRLTLNPLAHVDPFGAVLLLLTGFGWAKPVPINPNRFRNYRSGMMLTAAAGPVSNLLQMVFWALLLKLLLIAGIYEKFFISVCTAGISVNLMLMAFNLIPIPPLDGGRIVSGLLPDRAAAAFDRIEPYGMIILLVLMVGGGLSFFVRPFLMFGQMVVELLL